MTAFYEADGIRRMVAARRQNAEQAVMWG